MSIESICALVLASASVLGLVRPRWILLLLKALVASALGGAGLTATLVSVRPAFVEQLPLALAPDPAAALALAACTIVVGLPLRALLEQALQNAEQSHVLERLRDDLQRSIQALIKQALARPTSPTAADAQRASGAAPAPVRPLKEVLSEILQQPAHNS